MRLPIILVQNPPASGAALADALVGNLIGRAGLDLTLVNQFESLAPDSTDRMTLEGITVPAAVLDWRTTSEIKSALDKIGFNGRRCPHHLDRAENENDAVETSTNQSTRRLFLFDLNATTDPMAIVAELDRLRESLSVKTVSLGGLSAPRTKTEPSVTKPGNATTPPASAPRTTSQSAPPVEPTSDAGLDALLDQLDELDV